ncbi:3-keto-5-aminohexanoate cleavage enzyme [Maritalea myrionectae]|uniref:3-keto-5-aminohexanoate cleavage enzyme n=1 Tax=Maritalea myrionectae TaxID=454601 RepID=A0A2R4MC55_9HYPH|nr:3-keto-5-aminohexanoate cleavage protein [Maritalea myrionectae]AVX03618.1 3-keto-5-aminohexanoate cleavage enzyme [Maritalea myrionectae]
MSNKVIVSCALTGSIHTPSMSPHLPVTGAEMVREGKAASDAGASILHLHARDPETGQPSADLAHWQGFYPQLAEQSDAILNMSTGGSAVMSLDDRLSASSQLQPEMASLNLGTMNFALYPLADRIKSWKHEWEEPFLRNSNDLVFKNTPRDIGEIVRTLDVRPTVFELECYDISHLYMLDHLASKGVLKPPFFLQFVLGVLGGAPPLPEVLYFLKNTADKLFGADYTFSVIGAGRAQMQMAALSIALGGHVRVGLEDNLYIAKGELATSNAQQVEKVKALIEANGKQVATPTETRELLGINPDTDTQTIERRYL